MKSTVIHTESIGIKAKLSDYNQLIKFRLTFTVVLSSVLGYLIGMSGGVNWTELSALIIGGFLVVSSSNGLNQIVEKNYDILMTRTENRPLAQNRMGVLEGADLGLFGAQPHSSHEVEIAFALVGLEEFGIQPRHLRGLKSASEREIGIITGVTEPILRKKAPDSAAKAGHISREIAERFGAIRSHLITEVIEEIER